MRIRFNAQADLVGVCVEVGGSRIVFLHYLVLIRIHRWFRTEFASVAGSSAGLHLGWLTWFLAGKDASLTEPGEPERVQCKPGRWGAVPSLPPIRYSGRVSMRIASFPENFPIS